MDDIRLAIRTVATVAIEWSDDPSVSLVRALQKGLEPTRVHKHIVIEKHDVFSANLSQPNVARLVRSQIVFSPYNLNP
jgi:hypothetical protein